jgi:hypothetical protein
MALPSLSGVKRPTAEVRRVELSDPALSEPIVVYLRPLLRIERDAADAKGREFTARHITGGFLHPTTEAWTEEPEPILVDDQPVELTWEHAALMHRILAMQSPPKGEEPLTVDYMVQMAVKTDQAFAQLLDEASAVLVDGATGKAWGRAA